MISGCIGVAVWRGTVIFQEQWDRIQAHDGYTPKALFMDLDC